ncbi:LemA protein [Giesbergeria anulus]|uniref:LemA protein n=2 Tax=Giesbergeria anulus TaxID=180197 RepID=A0A1H9RVT2_9BURK|nr:LemA protein [Giesbergeria anulus]
MVFWAVGAYHRIMRLRSAALQAFGGLDVHWVRLLAMLGECDAAQVTAGWVMVAGRREWLAAMNRFAACLAVARARPLQPEVAAELLVARQALDATWAALLAGPDVPSDIWVPWAQRWEQQRQQNALATEQFNHAVAQYNEAITQFPASILARFFGFKAAVPL